MRTIYVEGNIIFETGVSWVRKIGAFREKRYKAMADEVVIGDLFINKDNRTRSYIEYMAMKDVVCYGAADGNCRFLTNPNDIIENYRNNNELVKEFAMV